MSSEFQPCLEIKSHLFVNIVCTYNSERVEGRQFYQRKKITFWRCATCWLRKWNDVVDEILIIIKQNFCPFSERPDSKVRVKTRMQKVLQKVFASLFEAFPMNDTWTLRLMIRCTQRYYSLITSQQRYVTARALHSDRCHSYLSHCLIWLIEVSFVWERWAATGGIAVSK